jgi:D-alanyl-D-alanine-carboxypeptidase/D-alanyl-D-alanine-endopeptidase
MIDTSLHRLTVSFTALLFVAGAAAAASAEDRELQEATDFTGTVMYLSAEVPGLIFGAVRNGEKALVGFGETTDGSGKEPDENSIFRIASVSKVFCGNVLGSLVVDGTVGLTDPLQAYVGEGVTVPTKDGRTLRLIDLVGQNSGLPRELNRPDSPPEDPFATNTKEVQLAEIQKDQYLFAPGTSAFYSNYGYDLLGTALSNAAGKPYADLLKERVLDPLGMKDTSFNPPADAKDRLMQGHFFDGSPLPNVPTSVGIECAGGLHTTGADMLRFIAWNLDRTGEDLREVRQITQAAHVYRDGLKTVVGIDDAGPMGAMGLGWVINFPEGNRPLILEKTGGLQGFFIYVAIASTRGVGAFFVMNEFNAGAYHGAVTATNNFVASMATR